MLPSPPCLSCPSLSLLRVIDTTSLAEVHTPLSFGFTSYGGLGKRVEVSDDNMREERASGGGSAPEACDVTD